MEFEKPFKWEIKIAMYGRDDVTNRILDFKFYVLGSGLTDMGGNELPPERTMHVIKVADHLDSNIPEEELTHEKCVDLIMKSMQPGQWEQILQSLYKVLYPGVTYYPAMFKQ